MTRIIRLSCGGLMEVPCTEWCTECHARPKKVTKVDLSAETGELPYYQCRECGAKWDYIV